LSIENGLLQNTINIQVKKKPQANITMENQKGERKMDMQSTHKIIVNYTINKQVQK
jgi:uncharacterized protein YjdB